MRSGRIGGRWCAVCAVLAWALPAAGQVTFRNGVSPTASYSGTRDVTIVKRDVGDVAQNPNANYNDDPLQDNTVDGHTGKKCTLMKWDVSAIPAGSTVTDASITIDVTDSSATTAGLYEVLRDWTDSEATWNEYRAGQAWSVSGARGIGSDRSASDIGTISADATGAMTINLNATGVALVQGWVNDAASNRGVIAANLEIADAGVNLGLADALKWSDSSDTPASRRPKLTVTHSGGTVTEFQNGALPAASYAGQSDTLIAVGPNYASWDTLGHAIANGTYPSLSLIAFDLSSIPSDAVVTAASLEFEVQRGTAGSYPIFEALRSWTEEAGWDKYDATNAWSAAGASAVNADRGSVVLGSLLPAAAGPVTVALNSDGVQLVQGWVSGARPNRGLVIERDPSVTGIAFLRDSEDANTLANRPALVVTYQSVNATQLGFAVQPSDTVAGASMSPAIQVAVQDSNGLTVTSSSQAITLALGDNPGGATLSGTLTANAVNGVATFSSLVLEKAGSGYSLQASASGLGSATSGPFQIMAAAPARLAIVTPPRTAPAGACSAAVTVELRDAFGNIASAAAPTVLALTTSSDQGSFSSASGCASAVTEVVMAAGGTSATFYFADERAGSPTLTVAATGLTTTSQVQQVVGGSASRLVVSGFPAAASANTPGTFTVQALDPFGNPASYAGTVSFRSSDPRAVLPPDYAFLPSDGGVASFTARLRTAGIHTLTVVDAADASLSGEESGIAIRAGAPAVVRLTPRPATVSAGAAVEVDLSIEDGWDNVCTDYLGSVHLSATDAQAVLAGPVDFAAAHAGLRTVPEAARFFTPGAQTLTARDAAVGTLSGSVDVQVEAALAPVIARDANLQAAANQPYRYSALGSMRVSGAGPLVFSRCGGPAELSVEPASGTVRWTPTVPGPVAVCLRADNADGFDQYDFTVQVAARAPTPVTASFQATPSSGASPLTVAFDANGSDADPTAQPLMLRWSFGDGSAPGVGVAPQHVYRLPGSYRPRLVAYDAYGASSSAEGRIVVLGASQARPPNARIVASEVEGTGSLGVTFRCDCQAGTAPITALRWELGQGAPTAEEAPAVTYAPGRYHVKLTAVDAAGLTSSDTVEIVVRDAAGREPPECESSSDPVAGPAPLSGRFLARAAGALPLSLSWTLDDGSVATGAQVERFWAQPGRHGASLTVEDSSGLRCQDRAEVVVLDGAGRAPPRIVRLPGPLAQCGRAYAGGRPVAEGEGIVWSVQETSVAGLSVDPATGELRWRPHPAQSGTQRVVVTASNDAGSDRQEFQVEVECSAIALSVASCGCGSGGSSDGAAGLLSIILLGAWTCRGRRAGTAG